MLSTHYTLNYRVWSQAISILVCYLLHCFLRDIFTCHPPSFLYILIRVCHFCETKCAILIQNGLEASQNWFKYHTICSHQKRILRNSFPLLRENGFWPLWYTLLLNAVDLLAIVAIFSYSETLAQLKQNWKNALRAEYCETALNNSKCCNFYEVNISHLFQPNDAGKILILL